MFAVPAAVRAKAVPAGAGQWLDDLPALVADLQRRWSITVGRVYQDAAEAFVAEATGAAGEPAVLAAGEPAVLKVMLPRAGDAARHEMTVLRLTDGEGCVRMLRHDERAGAMLLERLGPALSDLGLPLGRRHEILCGAAARVWRPAADRISAEFAGPL